MKWFNISEEELKRQKEILTPTDEVLSWNYLEYVRDNRIENWNSPTKIICGDKDNLTEKKDIDAFMNKCTAELHIVNNGEHYLQSDVEIKELKEWIDNKI